MIKLFTLLLALLALSLSTGCSRIKLTTNESGSAPATAGPDFDAGKELVKVNSASIREGFLEVLSNINPRVKAQLENPTARQQLLENLVEQELMYQASLKGGMDKKKEVEQKIEVYRRVIIAQALLEEELAKKAREYYEEKKNEEFTKVKISQIQINFKKPEEAKAGEEKKDKKGEATAEEKAAALAKAGEVKERLAKGEDFAKLAEELSDDKTSKKKGGDMGSINRNDKRLSRRGMEKLGEAAFALREGELSEPIESEKAYHLVKVTSPVETVPFEEAEKVIRFQIQKEVKDAFLADLKKKATIKFAEVPKAEPVPAIPEPAPEGAPLGGAPAPVDAGAPAPSAPPEEPIAKPSTPEPNQPQEGAPSGPVTKPGTMKFEEKGEPAPEGGSVGAPEAPKAEGTALSPPPKAPAP